MANITSDDIVVIRGAVRPGELARLERHRCQPVPVLVLPPTLPRGPDTVIITATPGAGGLIVELTRCHTDSGGARGSPARTGSAT